MKDFIDRREELLQFAREHFGLSQTKDSDKHAWSFIAHFINSWLVHYGLWNRIDEVYPAEGFRKTYPYPDYDWEVHLIARRHQDKKLNRALTFKYKDQPVVYDVLNALDRRHLSVHNMSKESTVKKDLFDFTYRLLYKPLKAHFPEIKTSTIISFVHEMHTSIMDYGDFNQESLRNNLKEREELDTAID